jgi:hypothetical protein
VGDVGGITAPGAQATLLVYKRGVPDGAGPAGGKDEGAAHLGQCVLVFDPRWLQAGGDAVYDHEVFVEHLPFAARIVRRLGRSRLLLMRG